MLHSANLWANIVSNLVSLQLFGYLFCEQETISYKIDVFLAEVRRHDLLTCWSI